MTLCQTRESDISPQGRKRLCVLSLPPLITASTTYTKLHQSSTLLRGTPWGGRQLSQHLS